MLTEPELAAMRATAEEALPGTAVIQTSGWVSDGGGGGTTGWTNAGTIACRMAPITSAGDDEGETGERITADSRFLFTLPAGTTVTTNSRILHSGGTFNVENVRERSWNVSTRVETVRQT